MKILLVHNFYRERGGEDVVVEAELRLLKSRGHDVGSYFVRNDSIVRWWQKLATALLTVYNPWAEAAIARKLREFKPDIVHVHNFFPLLSPSIFYACKRLGVPTVMTLHNFRTLCPTAFLYHDESLRERSLKSSSFWTVRQRTYRSSFVGTFVVACMVDLHKWIGTWRSKVDCFIALTDFAKEKFIEGGLPGERIVVKGNAFAEPVNQTRKSDQVRHGALYVGRLSQEKGIANLLFAWHGIDYPLRIVGDGALLSVCKEAQNENITYVGRLEAAQVNEEMRRASFLVLPSVWYEMFPMTLVEAYGNELPVLANRLGGLKSLVIDGVTGLTMEVRCPEDVKAKVTWASRNTAQMLQMGSNARKVFEQSYCEDTNYANLMQIYATVLRDRKTG